MKVSDFFQNIALGELNGSNMTELSGFEILEAKLPIVINSLNQGLDFLFTRFDLKESQVVIQLKEGITRYYIDSDYALSNQNLSLPKYLLDSVDNPYPDDLLQVLQVFDENGNELCVNDEYAQYGVFTPEYNCIQVSENVLQSAEYLVVIYRAKHSKIPLDTPRNSKINLNIPVSFNTALQTYVASLVYMNQGGQEYLSIGNALYAKAMTLLEEADKQGIGYKPKQGINIKPIIGEWL